MALFALLTAFTVSGDTPISCSMTAIDTDTPLTIAVTLDPVPSLKDRPGLYRVMMGIGDNKLTANAQPMTETVEDDVMFRAKAGNNAVYTLGLRRDGAAAMYVVQQGANVTLTGQCQRHERWFHGWLAPTD
ncbi:MAG: hypothetical protein AAFW64_00500 [Pseudomonadota bacterium]